MRERGPLAKIKYLADTRVHLCHSQFSAVRWDLGTETITLWVMLKPEKTTLDRWKIGLTKEVLRQFFFQGIRGYSVAIEMLHEKAIRIS